MTQKNTLKVFPVKPASLIKRMLLGAVIGLILITIFLLGAQNTDPAWGRLWMIKPLIIVPLAGGLGGAFNYFIHQQEFRHGWKKIVAIIFSLMVFIFALWLGTVLGLNGTYWD